MLVRINNCHSHLFLYSHSCHKYLLSFQNVPHRHHGPWGNTWELEGVMLSQRLQGSRPGVLDNLISNLPPPSILTAIAHTCPLSPRLKCPRRGSVTACEMAPLCSAL